MKPMSSPASLQGSNCQSPVRRLALLLFIFMVAMTLIFYSESTSHLIKSDFSCGTKVVSTMDVRSDTLSGGEVHSSYSKIDLDFAVIGFPKTGTTFLLEVLGQHKEIKMVLSGNLKSGGEFCEIHEKGGEKKLAHAIKNKTFEVNSLKYGIKCPTMVRNTNAIENLAKLSTDYTRLIVGVRHPALFFQSFYNYRVMWAHWRNESVSTIPSPNDLTAKKQWEDVSTSYARFDIFLKQFAKVPLDDKDLKDIIEEKLWKKGITPNKFKIFIYSVEQLNDHNKTRQEQFGQDLQHFLRLETPFPDFDTIPKVNENHEVFPEYMEICSSEFDNLRKLLVEQGKKTSKWIGSKFVHADDVVVSNIDHFQSVLSTWGKDPCL